MKLLSFSEGWGVSHFSMMKSTVVELKSLSSFKPMYCSREYHTSTRLNQQYEKSTLKFKILVRLGSVIFPCQGQIWNLKNFPWEFGVGHLSMSRPNLKFKIYCRRVGHLSMSRPNLKLKIFSEVGGSVIFPYLGPIWNLKFSVRVWGSVIFSCPGQIWNSKFSVRLGSQSSFHVQVKSEI